MIMLKLLTKLKIMNIVKNEVKPLIKYGERVLVVATLIAAIYGNYTFAFNLLWGYGLITLLVALLMVLAQTQVYRPESDKSKTNRTLFNVLVWLALAASGQWALFMLYLIADLLLTAMTSVTAQQYSDFLAGTESKLE